MMLASKINQLKEIEKLDEVEKVLKIYVRPFDRWGEEAKIKGARAFEDCLHRILNRGKLEGFYGEYEKKEEARLFQSIQNFN